MPAASPRCEDNRSLRPPDFPEQMNAPVSGFPRRVPPDLPWIEGRRSEKRGLHLIVLAFVLLYGASFRLDQPGWPVSQTAWEMEAVERTVLATAQSLVLHQGTAIEGGLGKVGRDRRYYPRFGVGAPLVHAPLYAAGRLLSGGRRAVAWHAARATTVLLGALVVVLTYRLGRLVSEGTAGAAAAALAAGAGTVLWPAAQWITPQLTSALTVALAGMAALSYRRYPRGQSLLMAGVALGAAVLVRPVNVVLVPVLFVYVFADRPRLIRAQLGRMPVLLAPPAAAVAWTLWHNSARFGRWLDFGYGARRAAAPLGHNLPDLLVGLQAGLVWFNPPVLLGLAAIVWLTVRRRREAAGLAALAAAAIVTAAVWHDLNGPQAAEPTLLVEAIPFLVAPVAALLAPAGGRRGRVAGRWPIGAALAVLAAVGALVQTPAVLAPDQTGRATTWWGAWPAVGAGLAILAAGTAAAALCLAVRHDRTR